MKERLLKFLNKEDMTSAKLADEIGVQPSSISHILSGRNYPGYEFMQKILTKYPSLNADWLIMGKGDMYKQPVQQELSFTDKPKVEVKNDLKTIEPNETTINTDLSNSTVVGLTENPIIDKVIIFYKDGRYYEFKPA